MTSMTETATEQANLAHRTWRRVRDVMRRTFGDSWPPDGSKTRVQFAYDPRLNRHVVWVGNVAYVCEPGDDPEAADVVERHPDGTVARYGGATL